MTISRPRIDATYPDRPLDCQQAIEAHVNTMMEQAIAAGWSRAEAAVALVEVADNYILGAAQNDELDDILKNH